MRAHSKSKEKQIKVMFGDEVVSYKPESKRALDIEMLILNLLLYILIVLYSINFVTTAVFMVLFYFIAMRVFMGGHDRFHSNHKERLPRFAEVISESFFVVVTPWDEPYDSIKRKHITHHATHGPGKSSKFDTKSDPHSAFELGGFLSAFWSSVFYEEVQLYSDIRDRRLTKSRLHRFLIYVPLLIIFITTFGWLKYLVVFTAMRLVGFSVWFVFSYVFHQAYFFKYGFAKRVPQWLTLINSFLFGRRIAVGNIHHIIHHAWPGVPYNQLHKFDSAALKHPDVAPEMRPIGY